MVSEGIKGTRALRAAPSNSKGSSEAEPKQSLPLRGCKVQLSMSGPRKTSEPVPAVSAALDLAEASKAVTGFTVPPEGAGLVDSSGPRSLGGPGIKKGM